MRALLPIFLGFYIIACNTSAPQTGSGGATQTAQSAAAATSSREDHKSKASQRPAASSSSEKSDAAGVQSKSDARSTMKPLTVGDIVAVIQLSPRSLSMKLRLKGGEARVFKPILKSDHRARYEVAAYRMASFLGVEGVPPATMGTLPMAFLMSRLSIDDKAAAEALEQKAALTGKGGILGAEIAWVIDLDPDGLERLGGVAALKSWIAPARPVMSLEPQLSRAVSRMVSFDYVIGNWDRFSGGNLFVNRAADGLVLIDHNGTFAPWSGAREERMVRLLKNTERFSRSLVNRLRGVTAQTIGEALAKEPSHSMAPLLSADEIRLILDRRDTLLAHVDGLVAKHGASRVLVFE